MLTSSQCMAYWCHHGRYPREICPREVARKRQGRCTYHERRDHKKVLAKYQEMLEFQPDSLATNHSSAAHGLVGHL